MSKVSPSNCLNKYSPICNYTLAMFTDSIIYTILVINTAAVYFSMVAVREVFIQIKVNL